MTQPSPITSAAPSAHHYLRQRILTGDLPGGQMLSEVQIAQELGISRTPVHEAFLRLESEDLLTLSPKKGAIVAPMTPTEVADVLEMRQMLEVDSAAKIIAQGKAAALLPLLREILAVQADHLAAGEKAAFAETDDRFHEAVILGTGNRLKERMWRQISLRQQRLRYQFLIVKPEDLPGAYADHLGLADALEQGDAVAYASLLAAHIERYRGAV